MHAVKVTKSLVFIAALAGPAAALACGELQFNAGKGLPFQTYLAPRPADVLILSSDTSQNTDYEQLASAGHRLTVVSDTEAMAQALQRGHYDIVIAAYESMDTVSRQVVASGVSAPRLLPVVARAMRRNSALRERFAQFVIDGASLGQYLTAINRIVAS